MPQKGHAVRALGGCTTDEKSATRRQARKNYLRLNERCGNVYENKGLLWKTWGRSWNVIENKATYW
jgi:hypothetical protein